ncbi:MsnO8 family LLM class oxidoreductase [Streptomyces sp. NPDC005840]|uniref:MsnO8 family LLM class oxidoreductase n=1 Tax=Streptomyces doudnae TaxID=3075536 RepID=A0ABD5EGK1_9ACTN|nr:MULTISPECIES: MsnO8 family LLM class oxidoreductase [unclassified Streptomyces]MDT0433512.1 MsnO8 family LLM class oxidoreductase [Streptomyces sp. DSM 41981]MYQ67671.1 MsnO8 family LLM class oxidoreductase [Streptomyces sp. SID4950]SCE38419.1 luciferase family oxidoreductase, group 1 [Streptomyces sp. SolWspMP-5a-2]
MSSLIGGVRFSVLDRSRTREGHSDAQALRDTVRLAQDLEGLGYHRFWVSEHHGVPGVAGSAPTVLAAAVAAATRTIRVGTGGVMLPNHRPLVVAEQFGVLESLFPGRIDMGLGRSVGFTGGVRKALGHGKDDAEDFAGQLDELLGWFRGTSPTGVRARPSEGLTVPPFVLAMGDGARIAARAGLPMVIGDLRDRERMRRGVDAYRAGFRPSPWAAEPYVVVSGTVAVAADPAAARRLLVPEAWSMAYSRTRGTFPPLAPAERVEALAMTDRERGLYEKGLTGQLAGTAEQVGAELEAVLAETGAQEVLVTTSTWDRTALLDSYRRLAALFGGARAPSAAAGGARGR